MRSRIYSKVYTLRSEKCTYTSTGSMMNSDVIMGKMQRASGVVRSVNQNAPPPFKDGTFSTMFDIYKHERRIKWQIVCENRNSEGGCVG